MLCRSIHDPVESRSGQVEAMGMLDVDIAFEAGKVLRRREGSLHGYEIHHGRVARCAEATWFEVDGVPEGYRRGQVYGTHWHGLFDNDEFRRQWLRAAAAAAGRDGFVVADDTDVVAQRDAQLDRMGDLLNAHLDVDAITGLLDYGPPRRPTIVVVLRCAAQRALPAYDALCERLHTASLRTIAVAPDPRLTPKSVVGILDVLDVSWGVLAGDREGAELAWDLAATRLDRFTGLVVI